MLNQDKYLNKVYKVEKVVEIFLKERKTIYEMAADKSLGISKSSIHRYLNDEDIIRYIYGDQSDFIIEEIKRRLKENKEIGNKNGGDTFASDYVALKDSKGLFKGSKRR
ncbi:MAG: hypothetical protein Q4E75_00205 [bacterium]|nr:hypothetical protein [bacterium]